MSQVDETSAYCVAMAGFHLGGAGWAGESGKLDDETLHLMGTCGTAEAEQRDREFEAVELILDYTDLDADGDWMLIHPSNKDARFELALALIDSGWGACQVGAGCGEREAESWL